jgi:inorganic pyrophosphatase
MYELGLIIPAGIAGILFAGYLFQQVSSISLEESGDKDPLISSEQDKLERLREIYEAIRGGAKAFLFAEYRICAIFIVLFGVVVFIATSFVDGKFDGKVGGLTCASFVTGAVTSIVSGYIGMMVAVFSNARTTVAAMPAVADNLESKGRAWTGAFNTAFRAGGVMGFSLCGLGMLVLFALCQLYAVAYDYKDKAARLHLFECIAGFGLGGSSIALFGRVGGGIYTKAADVGADLAGKVVEDIPEDDPRNPATIADNVGDNVGDVAGMGSDLFGSFAEASCAALVVGASCQATEWTGDHLWEHLMFPIALSAAGIFVCIICFFVATHVRPVKKEEDVETVLKIQLAVTTVVLTGVIYVVALGFVPHDGASFNRVGEMLDPSDPTGKTFVQVTLTPMKAWACVCCGLWSGCIIGFVTEYYTSHSYTPVRDVAQSCLTGGAATNIIYGLALGFQSCIIPVALLAIDVYVSFKLADMYGVALAALGMLSNLATCLSIDVYGPVCDNAGGIAEMSELHPNVREVTDALDAAGNTTAAIGKGFAIGSACLVGLALFGAFMTRAGLKTAEVSILSPIIFACLLFGAMIPYWFSAMTMKSVGLAANEMVVEVARQFREIPGLLKGERDANGNLPKPDHAKCIKISTDASLREMIWPAVLVMTTPLACGFLFGSAAVAGLLAGAIVSAVQMAISQSNTGGAWDNAKKFVEKGEIKENYGKPDASKVYLDDLDKEGKKKNKHGKGSDCHKAAVVGDTVGDPLKDTSGPALNIVMKLMAILSLVFADSFKSINEGHGAFKISAV